MTTARAQREVSRRPLPPIVLLSPLCAYSGSGTQPYMSQTSQVALAGSSALVNPQSTTPKSQHNIPRFLLKLYELVVFLYVCLSSPNSVLPRILSDPTNENLIKWSDAGDSFYSTYC